MPSNLHGNDALSYLTGLKLLLYGILFFQGGMVLFIAGSTAGGSPSVAWESPLSSMPWLPHSVGLLVILGPLVIGPLVGLWGLRAPRWSTSRPLRRVGFVSFISADLLSGMFYSGFMGGLALEWGWVEASQASLAGTLMIGLPILAGILFIRLTGRDYGRTLAEGSLVGIAFLAFWLLLPDSGPPPGVGNGTISFLGISALVPLAILDIGFLWAPES